MTNKDNTKGRRVFISVLGKSMYGRCHYTDGDFKSSYTRFIQQATLEYHGAETWPSDSIGYIMVTEDAHKDNWLTQEGRKDRNGEEYVGLESSIQDMALPFPIENIRIDEGKNEEEIMGIFLKIYDKLNDGDRLYIDITHGFRYLPMLVLVLSNFAKFTKNVVCESITYGNYETRIAVDGRDEAPIINLNYLSLLQDWTDATEHFLYSGNTKKMTELCTEEIRTSRGTNEKYKTLKKLVSPLSALTDDMKTCQGRNIISGRNFASLETQFNSIESQNLPAEFQPILQKIKSEFSSFDTSENWMNGLHAANWCLEHQQYQQAITLLRETIVTGICIRFGYSWTSESDRNRISNVIPSVGMIYGAVKSSKEDSGMETSEQILKKLDDDRFLSDKKISLSEPEMEIAKAIAADTDLLRLSTIYYNARYARNQYNHAGMLKEEKDKPYFTSGRLIEQIESRIQETNDWLESINHPSSLFINLTNHPSDGWDDRQTSQARAYGEIMDLPFPVIAETDQEKDIRELVDSYVMRIEEMSGNTPCVVHVMGEMTFTYAMVCELKGKGYTCVASTSRRIVDELPDGSKNVKFEFCKFREY